MDNVKSLFLAMGRYLREGTGSRGADQRNETKMCVPSVTFGSVSSGRLDVRRYVRNNALLVCGEVITILLGIFSR